MNKFLALIGGIGASSAVLAQEGGMNLDESGALIEDAGAAIQSFATDYIMPALIIVITVGLGIAVAFWGIRKLRSALNK